MSTRSFLESSIWPAQAASERHGVAVRTIRCRSILNRSDISDYTLNCYTGCSHGCAYCYARFMQRFHPHPEPWGRFVDVKVNALSALTRQVRRSPPGTVFVSSACDAWQPVEESFGLTRRCCELLVSHGFRIHALTKSSLILRDLDVLIRGDSTIGVTLTTLDECVRRIWEPRASPVEDRLRVLSEARAAGIRTAIMLGPLLPGLSDSPGKISGLLQCAADHGVSEIYVDALNRRPRVWQSVSTTLARHHPELLPLYRRIFFDDTQRAIYLRTLRRRVNAAARRLHLWGRVHPCC